MQQRRFQQEFLDQIVLKAEQCAQNRQWPFVMTGNIYPGSGKTLTALQAADVLYKRRDIDTSVTLVPRRNLAAQTEKSWRASRGAFAPNALGPINHRDNKWPLIRQGESGYVTTYQSLGANPALHHDQLQGRRVLLVLDEAQQLGADYAGTQGEYGTVSADHVQRLVEAVDVRGIIIMTGTPFRADNNPLLFARYEVRADRREYLVADVTASYSDGIEGEYLRVFDAHLYDGEVDWERANRSETLTLSQYDRSLRPFLVESPEVWQGLTDVFVEHLQVRQQIDRRFCGLIACYNQEQAAQVEAYLRRRHATLRVLKAVSDDGEEAQKNLDLFRTTAYDVLVTVQMAYIGYDQPFISVVLPLTGIREIGYLRQLLARSLRVVSGISYDQQAALWVVPGDSRMRAFIEQERQELDYGLKRRETRQQEEAAMVLLPEREQGRVVGGRLTTQTVMGIYPEGDVSADELPFWEQLVTDLKPGLSPAYAKALVARYERAHESAPRPAEPLTQKTQQENERDALDVLHRVIRNVVHQVMCFRTECRSKADYGRAQRAIRRYLKRLFRKSSSALTVEEIDQQIVLVQSWLADDGVPEAVLALYRRLP